MRIFITLLFIFAMARTSIAQRAVDFEANVRPLLLKHCSECHGPKMQKSGLRLDARHAALKGGDSGEAIVPRRSLDSLLYQRIVSDNADEKMPPEGPGLTKVESDLIRDWIDAGAIWPETDYDRTAAVDTRLQHWAFQPLQKFEVPQVSSFPTDGSNNGVDQTLNEIDRFVLAKLQERGLSLNNQADRRTLIRRLSFIITGLPADQQQIAAFESSDDPSAWSSLVNEQLASVHYGERWAQHWLDVIRYADTHGFEVNTPRANAWPYRDYVIRAFNEDKPYDQFVREQLAGDVFHADDATGFLVASAVLLPGQIGADEESKRLARQDALDEIISGTSSALLGLTIACARCHDHKFDPITQLDYYSLQSYFAGVDYGERPIRDAQYGQKKNKAAAITKRIAKLESTLQSFEPTAHSGRTYILDEEDKTVVSYLKKENGPGVNPDGPKPGYKDDAGSIDRVGNISRGRYTWWNNVPGEDVMTYNPGIAGSFQLWISWGAHGSGVHTRDARYVLDQDGRLETKDDQKELASVDQYYLAGVREGQTEQTPLWSGLQSVGQIELTRESKIILRGGETGSGITADVIVLQEVPAENGNGNESEKGRDNHHESELKTSPLPQLRPPVTAIRNVERFSPVKARFVRLTTFATINQNQHEPCIDELEVYSTQSPATNVGLASAGTIPSSSGNISETGIHQLKHVNDGVYGNSHSWISNQHGGGWVQLQMPQAMELDRIVWSRDRNGKFADRLPIHYEVSVSLNGNNWTVVAGSSDRVSMGSPFDAISAMLRQHSGSSSTDLAKLAHELESLRREKASLEAPQMVFAGSFRAPEKTYLLRRGDPEQRLEETQPRVPTVFETLTASSAETSAATLAAKQQHLDHVDANNPDLKLTAEQQRRLDLADWIVSPDNPLTARVMVNRIWLQHFGRGLVDTPNDFGINGAPPTHPELLDWLAAEFIRSGWSIKHMQRLILNSATWKQSSVINAEAASVDRDNTLLWRFTSRRLEGEIIRDNMLAVSGELNLKMGGPGFNFFKTRGGLDGFPPLEEFTTEEMRRMIYSHKVRMEQVPVFGAFDCPDAGQSMPRRGRSTTAIQALNLFNSRFVADRADSFAAAVLRDVPNGEDQQVSAAFLKALGRQPSEIELTASMQVVREHGLSTLCRVLYNSSEFLFVP